VVQQMLAAARSLADELASREGMDAGRLYELADSFRGLVLAMAIQARGGWEEGFRTVGQEKVIENRNHHRVLKRELKRVRELFQQLGYEGVAGMQAIFDEFLGS
jgi:hypothetical protein